MSTPAQREGGRPAAEAQPSAAARRWADALAGWAIPEPILAGAVDSPHGFDVGLFTRIAEDALETETPSQRLAREVLPAGGSVLDVGAGAGAASLPLVPPAGRVVGVDEQDDMLAAFAERAAARGATHAQVRGRWPDVADAVPACDVAVCHNVLYNVAAIEPFVLALDARAHERVVVEVSDGHPLAWLAPYWRRLHGLDRPTRPTAGDAFAVLTALGLDPRIERWSRPHRWDVEDEDALTEFVRRRLCLPPERGDDVRAAVRAEPPAPSRPVATLWWNASGGVPLEPIP